MLHVGDTRIYRVHAGSLEQLSQDHRVRISDEEQFLGRALGTAAHVDLDYACWPAEPGEIYLLASDGAYDRLDAAAVRTALGRFPADLSAAARELAQFAQAQGSDDDATVQLVRIEALPAPEFQQLQAERGTLAMPPPLRPGMHFEGYTILRELHVGARSQVHLARDESTGQQVALKIPSIELRESPSSLDRFVLEEWVARRVDSSYVMRAAVADRPRQHLFVALEYVEGRTLAQWTTDHPRPDLEAVRRIVEQIARGLQALHRREMLHQDLRPANVIIDSAGSVKIIDLAAVHVAGLAEGTADADASAIVGELQYTAPEYFTGGGGTPASDLFSLAVMTYHMLGGQLPYGLQVPQLRDPRDLSRLQYTSLRRLRPDLPAWLDAVLRKALHPQASRRQEALSEFVHDLRSPGPEFLNDRPQPLLERDPVAFWRALALLLLAATVVLAALLLSRH
jgi:hypothetical protein